MSDSHSNGMEEVSKSVEMKHGSNNLKSYANDELLLIQQAHLTRSAVDRHTTASCVSDIDQNGTPAVDEYMLIANAVLAKSEVDENVSDISNRLVDEILIICTENGQLRDKINTAHTSKVENQPKEISHFKTDAERTKCTIREMSPIPRLDIDDIHKDQENDTCFPDMDGCITPTNSETIEDKEEEEDDEDEITARTVIENKPGIQQANVEDTPTDIDFNNLVIDMANSISSAELEMIRNMFRGTDGTVDKASECVTAELESPLLFLNLLRKYRLISRDNLYHLQAIIMKLNKAELHAKAVQYVKHNTDVVYFYPPSDNIPSNYGTVKCHIEGKDFTRLKRTDLEHIRSKMSTLLFMPPQLVYIVGIEPGLSVVITLMLPKFYLETLGEMADEGIPELVTIGIDTLRMGDKTYNMKGKMTSMLHSDDDHMKFLTVFHQLRDKSKTLEQKDSEIQRLKYEAELMKLDLDTMSAKLELLTEQVAHDYIGRNPIRRNSKNHWRTSSFPLQYVSRSDEVDIASSRSYNLHRQSLPSTGSAADDVFYVASGSMAENWERGCLEEGIRRAEDKFETGRKELMGEIEQLLYELGTA